MRALLTGGIKAILAVAVLSTAAHWTLRVQRESPAPLPVAAGVPDPVVTGSIEPRRVERPVAVASAPPVAAVPVSAAKVAPASGLDQTHLAALIAGATPPKPKVAKAATKTASAEKTPSEKGAVRR
jgi:hypothetical protein